MICLQHHEHELHFLDSLGEKNDATFPKHQFLAQSNGLPSTTIIISVYKLHSHCLVMIHLTNQVFTSSQAKFRHHFSDTNTQEQRFGTIKLV